VTERNRLRGLTAILTLAMALPCAGITISRNFVEPGESFPEFGGLAGSAPSNAAGGGNLADVFNAAADWWEMAILDDHSLDIYFGWERLDGSTLAAATQYVDPQPPVYGEVSFDNDLSSVFYMDPLPTDSTEYETYTEYSDDLGGGDVNTGRVFTSPTGYAVGRVDLFSTALHEIGHLLGFNGLWSGNHINITAPLPYAGSSVPTTGSHIDISTALMYPYTSDGTRHLGSQVDILAGAENVGFVSVNLDPEFPFILHGDLNGDDSVGQTDLDIILDNWGDSAPLGNPLADVSGDGFVGQADLDVVLGYWGQSAPPAGAGAGQTLVPEPTSLAMIFALAAAFQALRRKRPA